jgi:hypothetical protein
VTRPTIRVELNFGAAPYSPGALVLDTGRLDVNVLDGVPAAPLVLDSPTQGQLDTNALAGDAFGEGFWTDLADFCESLSIRSGRKRSLESFAAARLTATLDNSDRRFDPTNLDGPYVVGALTAIVPMRPVRVVAEWAGAAYPLAFAYADSWGITWQDPAVSTTVLSCTDAFKVLADFDPLEVAPVGAGEDSGARVARILDNAGWSSAARDIDAGNSTLQATNLSANALGELKLTADSELGELYIAPDGKVTFRSRSARTSAPRSMNSQATFGDGAGLSLGLGLLTEDGHELSVEPDPGDEIGYADLAIAYDDEVIRNRANIARVGGTTQTAIDADSIARNQTHTHTRTDLLLQSDSDSDGYARTIVARHKDNELRFDALVLEPDGDDEVWPLALGLSFGDRVTIVRRPPGGGATIQRECFIEGKDIDLPAVGKWRFTFHLSDASRLGGLVLDNATRGTLDTAANALTF